MQNETSEFNGDRMEKMRLVIMIEGLDGDYDTFTNKRVLLVNTTREEASNLVDGLKETCEDRQRIDFRTEKN